MRDFSGIVAPFFGNQSLPAWIARAGFGQLMVDGVPVTAPLYLVISYTSTVAVVITTIAVFWRTRTNQFASEFEVRIVFILSGLLLVVSTSWEHYWLFCLPVLAWAIYEVWTERRLGWSQFWIAATAFFFLMKLTRFYTDTPFGRLASGSQTIGMFMLWGWLIWRLNRTTDLSTSSAAEVRV
jgi:hypothetical protein